MAFAPPRNLMPAFDIARSDQAETIPVNEDHMKAILSSFPAEACDHGGTETPLTTSAMLAALAEVMLCIRPAFHVAHDPHVWSARTHSTHHITPNMCFERYTNVRQQAMSDDDDDTAWAIDDPYAAIMYDARLLYDTIMMWVWLGKAGQ
jgi:hypothetical protein